MSPCLAEGLGLFGTGERSRALVLGEAGRRTFEENGPYQQAYDVSVYKTIKFGSNWM